MDARSLLICIVLVIYPHYSSTDQSEPLQTNDKEEERWRHADECFAMAVERVEMRCRDMTEDEQFFLQFDFMNCYLRMMGMDAVMCEERTRQACSAVLNTPQHKLHDNIFEKFYHDLPTLCYHAANALWRKQLRNRVHNLQSFSDETLRGLLESLRLQEVLEQQQDRLLGNQERILQQGQEMSRSISQQRQDMNSSFTQLNNNLTDQASVLRTFGNQLKHSLDSIHSVLGYVLGEVTGGIEVYVLLLCVVAMVTCLSATRQAHGILRWAMWWSVAEIAIEVVLRMLLTKETLVVFVSVWRQLVVCAALLLYLVLLLWRLLCPRVEDYNTELLIGRLSLQVQDMEERLQASGLLPSAPDTPHLHPQLSSSPRLGNESALASGGRSQEQEAPLPLPHDVSGWAQQVGPPSATIEFMEECAVEYDGGLDEVDSPIGPSSVPRIARKETREREGGRTRWGKGDNKQAEEEEEKEGEKQSRKTTRRKGNNGIKKRNDTFRTHKSTPSSRTDSDIAEADSSLSSVSRYNLRTRRPLHPMPVPSFNGSPQSRLSQETVDEVLGTSQQSPNLLSRSLLAARVVKSDETPPGSMEHKKSGSATLSTRRTRPRHSIL